MKETVDNVLGKRDKQHCQYKAGTGQIVLAQILLPDLNLVLSLKFPTPLL